MPKKDKHGNVYASDPRYTVVDAFQNFLDRASEDEVVGAVTNSLSKEYVVNLSDDQDEAYSQFRKWLRGAGDGDVFYLTGYAGSGKTMLASVIGADIMNDIAFCAYTGKAASVLRRKMVATGLDLSGHSISTMHSLMYAPITDKQGGLIGWSRKEQLTGKTMQDFRLIVVDEASMLTREALHDLMSYGIPILLIGDPMQLPPVKGDPVNPDDYTRVHLSKIHRQAEGNPIIEYSAEIRKGNFFPDLGTDPRLVSITSRQFEEELFRAYEKFGVDDVGILSYKNATRVTLNEIGLDLHKQLNGLPSDVEFFPDVPVMCLFNHHGNLLNGMRGKILGKPSAEHLWLVGKYDFASEGTMVEGDAFGPQFGQEKTLGSYSDFQKYMPRLQYDGWRDNVGLLFDYGYAMTTHKAQGSQFRKVFVTVERPNQVDDDDFQKWLYTSCTRASEELVMVEG